MPPDPQERIAQLETELARLRGAVEAGRIGVYHWDLDKDNIAWSEGLSTIVRRAPEEASGPGILKLIHPEDRAAAETSIRNAIERGDPIDLTFRVVGDDQVTRWIASRGKAERDETGRAACIVGINYDVTEPYRAEQLLRESQRQLQGLMENLPGVIFYQVLTSRDMREREYVYISPNAVNVLGVSPEHLAKAPSEMMGEVEYADLAEILKKERAAADTLEILDLEIDGKRRDGKVVRTRVITRPRITSDGKMIWDGVLIDITERVEAQAAAERELASRVRAEQELRVLNETLEQRVVEEVARRSQAEDALLQAQKMETLGQLTGGVAHDFNNLLQIVTGNIDIIRRNLPQESGRLGRAANNAARGAERAAVLTQRLLAFARRQPLEPKPIDPTQLVTGMSELLRRTLGEAIEIETALADGLWSVEIDPHQLENAILNLAINSRDAMQDGGKLTIEASNALLDDAYAAAHAGVSPGDYVSICVSDTGSGMDRETVEKAVEPFFTTKEVGKGTGLGLSMVYGFVKQSGGHFKIYSEVGEGTTVKIYLPRLENAGTLSEAAGGTLPAEGGRGETILVCEDDQDVRAYTVSALEELGYAVLEAEDGPSALRLLEQEDAHFDLLFTDVVLPGGMTGAVLATHAREIRPGIKILFTTGYARNAIVHQGRLDPGVQLITKPFSYSDLALRIREALDS